MNEDIHIHEHNTHEHNTHEHMHTQNDVIPLPGTLLPTGPALSKENPTARPASSATI